MSDGEPKNIRVRLALTRDDVLMERDAAALVNVEIGAEEPLPAKQSATTEAAFVGAVAVTIAATLAWVVKRLTDHWLRDQERGVLIDMRTSPVTISRVDGVPHGFVVTIDTDGKASSKRVDYEKPEELSTLLAPLLEKV